MAPCRATALGLMLAVAGVVGGCAAGPDEMRWSGSAAVTGPSPAVAADAWRGPGWGEPIPLLPGARSGGGAAGGSGAFWASRRDAELGGAAAGAPMASTQWPAPARPSEQIYRYRTILRN